MKELEHLKNGNYNPDVDYNEILTRYNEFVENGKQDEAKAILREFGGIISILGNKCKQEAINSLPKLKS